MKRALRWLRNGLIGLVVILIIAVTSAYVISERMIRRTYTAPATNITVPTDSASIAEGKRLAQIRGCTGCHGDQLAGQKFIDEPLLARVVAPDLTIAAREYSDPDLVRIIRRGVRPDGRSVVVMPSSMYTPLRDADLGRIIAYVRSVPPSDGERRSVTVGPVARIFLTLGEFKTAAVEVLEAEATTPALPQPGEANAEGAYLARTACTECHGTTLAGQGSSTPDLRIAAGYNLEQFTQLMRTGKALGNRELELMSSEARVRFSHFTDEEIRTLHSYLVSRAAAK